MSKKTSTPGTLLVWIKQEWIASLAVAFALLAVTLGLWAGYGSSGPGERGDWVGGHAGPAMALAGNLLIIATLIVQGRQLAVQREEAAATREQADKANSHRDIDLHLQTLSLLEDYAKSFAKDLREKVALIEEARVAGIREGLEEQIRQEKETRLLLTKIREVYDRKLEELSILDKTLSVALQLRGIETVGFHILDDDA